MRGRLFWKILIGFSLTFTAIWQGVWLLFTIYGGPPTPYHIGYLKETARGYIETAARIVEAEGLGPLEQAMAYWPQSERDRLSLEPVIDGAMINAAPAPEDRVEDIKVNGFLARDAISPVGLLVHLKFDVADIVAEIPDRGRFSVPTPLVIAGIIGGLIFSGVLAWYLARPIRQLQEGFERLSTGDLTWRLGEKIGRRRDEIADLARDFDVMAVRLQQLIEARDRLLNDVSHELRSPLARMQLAVGLARQKPDRIEGSLDRIEKETVRLDELVGELLTLSRAESGASQNQTWLDIDHLLGRVVSDARFEADATGIKVQTNLAIKRNWQGEVPVVIGNAELLRRAFENIVRNALRHSREGQLVRISAEADMDQKVFCITISDQGPGIPAEQLENMFEPFIRGEPGINGIGFGLGLSIARRAIKAHGGEIAIHNRDEGGLHVQITLPFTLRVQDE
ncbi:HAMP domain-containing sensor histidine kinase [Thalassospira alkalitolerans]|uniref:HAMP domain-containing sensor histidine kinase n=1 Tax=Thalassospira alkalitolerans TaxID=1293890 RepID=UPI0030EFA38D|tara:strand:- start:24577 stop:25935 length:1359 start_codon:yes stop_codon:yes gene_type:complete